MRYCAARGCSSRSATPIQASLLLMYDLDGIQTHRDLRWVKSCKHGRCIDHRQCAKKNLNRPVKSDRPAEGLFVDHINQDERQRKAQSQAGKIGEKSEQTGFDENQLANLPRSCAKKSQKAKLASAVNHQSKKCSGNSHHCDNDRDSLQSVSYGKGAVEDADRFRAQVSIRKHQHSVPSGGLLDFSSNHVQLRARRNINGKI